MSNEVGEPGGLPAGPVPGAVRFTDGGRLEIYGEDGWAPLQRLSDADLPAITRDAELPAEPLNSDADSTEASRKDNAPDRQAPL